MSVKSSLDKLSKKDTQSLLMFVLFKLSEIPETAVLSQLIYLLDETSLIKLLKYFEGQTITFPKIDELRVLIHTLTLYKSVDIDGEDFSVVFNSIPKLLQNKVYEQYEQVKAVMEGYSFVY